MILRLALPLLVVTACGVPAGDPQGSAPADRLGTGARLQELLGPAEWIDPMICCSSQCMTGSCLPCTNIPLDRHVEVTGVTITTIDTYDETSSGSTGNIYVQDTESATPEFSGVTVFDPGFSPPDLRVVPGDVVDMLGALTEFPGPSSAPFDFCRTLPEFSGALELRFESSVIEPVPLDVSTLASYESARPYLGVLVRIDQVKLLEPPFDSSSGRYSIRIDTGDPSLMGSDIPTITNEHFDLKNEVPGLVQGMTLASVTGIVTFFFGVHIAPRSAADVVR